MKNRGEVFAIGAAMCNGTIGMFSRFVMTGDNAHVGVATVRCVGAWLLLTAWLAYKSKLRMTVFGGTVCVRSAAILALFGIFILYFFETWAFQNASVSFVTFLVYSCGTVTVIGGVLFLGEKLTIRKAASGAAVVVGAFIVFAHNGHAPSLKAGAMAITAGVGYSVFLLLWKHLKYEPGIMSLWWFFGFGSLYLLVACGITGANVPDVTSPASFASIVALIVVPTLGGYFLTAMALNTSEAGKVQLIETSEPVFASVFAFAVFGETLTASGYIGATIILIGLMIIGLQREKLDS